MYKPIDEKTPQQMVDNDNIKIIPMNNIHGEHFLSLSNEKVMLKLFNFKLNGFRNNYMCLNLKASSYVNTQEKFELYMLSLIHILKGMVSSEDGRGFISIKSKDERVLEALYESGFSKIRAGKNLSSGETDTIYSGMGFFGDKGVV